VSPLAEVALLFLRLGFTSFGGPAAHIAMMEDEVVARRKWLTREELLDLIGAANLIPGPNSTELAIHLGYKRAGWPGLVVAGVCFIAPAVLIVSVLAWLYVRFGSVPKSLAVLDGIKPVVLAIVAQAAWRLGRTVLKSWFLGVLAVAAAAASLLGVHELAILGGAGLAVVLTRVRAPTAAMLLPVGAAGTATTMAVGLLPIFLVFLKIGSVLFGSGYVLLAFLRSDLVERYHWLTNAQLLDAVAIGQVTPGPVFTTATFVGWILQGPMGALVATVGIFLPAFVFVALSGPLVPRIRRSRLAGAALDGVNVASLALVAVVTWELGRSAITSWWSVGLAAISLVILLTTKLNSFWLIVLGALAGWLAH
jgi:chromate transporter